jgi:hypothetical protein
MASKWWRGPILPESNDDGRLRGDHSIPIEPERVPLESDVASECIFGIDVHVHPPASNEMAHASNWLIKMHVADWLSVLEHGGHRVPEVIMQVRLDRRPIVAYGLYWPGLESV